MRITLSLLLFCTIYANASADEPKKGDRPLQALLVTGGCCHDYDRQKLILTRGISARTDVRWTVVHQGGTTTNTPIPLYNDPDWAEGFDIVVHNECFSHVTDLEFVDRILKPHKDGTPAILIHCAMHCYRVEDDRWFKFVGLQSPGHGPHYSYTANNIKDDHPIMKDFGPLFVAPKGELYHSVKVFDTATPLAQANRQSDEMPQVCVWTNDYNGTRVFGCTMGHYNETMVEPKYLDMMTRGLLWAVGRDPEKHFTPTTEKIDDEIRQLVTVPVKKETNARLPGNCCGDANLAYGKPVTSKTEQNGNFRKHLTDGRLDTRYCPSSSATSEWVTVDLEKPTDVAAIRLHWEKSNDITYQYIVEVSADNETWTQVVDYSANEAPGSIHAHQMDAKSIRYIRTTFLGASRGLWGSIWELEATAGELPDLPKPQQQTVSTLDVSTPDGFRATLFGAPPEVSYPVCLTAAATGEVFVGVDEMGSLGKEKGRGKVLRCLDTDGDGQADQISEFAKMDHPRGLIYDNGSLWVLHPPTFSVFRDTDEDGTADESEVLIEGISTEQVDRRGADHTTNGIRMGIDGWIYIAVGDYGFVKAYAPKDGTTLSRRGGGIVRIRPDGTEMEIYSWGQRNIMDVAIDPFMNVFTRDNTNDGGGWDIRVSHILQTANYGYPSLYKNFSEEIMPPLADYGGGSGCGSMYFHDKRWPEGYHNLLLTCDWGRSEVFRHSLPANGATFDPQQETFLKLPRPTDIDADGSGRLYVSSWKNGKFSFSGENVGFVTQVTPVDFVPKPVPDFRELTDRELFAEFSGANAARSVVIQREILRRTAAQATLLVKWLRQLALDTDASLVNRVAAVFTLGQIASEESTASLQQLLDCDDVREHVIRALTDRLNRIKEAPRDHLIGALGDPSPRVQAAAIIGLGRVCGGTSSSDTEVANAILPLTAVPASDTAEGDDWRQPHPERVIPHLAVQTLVRLSATDECIAALNGPYRDGALWALKYMHDPRTVDGLFKILSTSRDKTLRREIWTTLIRLYHQEADYDGGWWGTRPDTTGPYFDRRKWSESDRIGNAVRVALAEADESLAAHLKEQLKRHVVKLEGVDSMKPEVSREPQIAIKMPKVDPDNPNQIANIAVADVLSRTMATKGNADSGKQLFISQSCVNCHTFANGQQPKGPHLVDIGKRYKKEELIESIIDPSKKIAQGFDTWTFAMASGKVHTGFVVLESAETVNIRQTDGLSRELLQDDIDDRVKQEISMMPKGIVANLTTQQLSDLIAYLQSLH